MCERWIVDAYRSSLSNLASAHRKLPLGDTKSALKLSPSYSRPNRQKHHKSLPNQSNNPISDNCTEINHTKLF